MAANGSGLRVGFCGMTHLGLVSAAGAAEKGFDVVGFDPDATKIDNILAGALPVSENGLEYLLTKNQDRVEFSARLDEIVTCDLVFIAQDVPTDDEGVSDMDAITKIIDLIRPHLAPTALLIILCQVPPGYTRSLDVDPSRICYLVETLIFGQAVHRTLNPERFIVGLADPGDGIPDAFHDYLRAYECPVLPMRFESAELAKISINMFLVASVTTTNVLAEICETVGADWSEIAPALRLDKRIGRHAYLRPGLGISGGNLERDLATIRKIGQDQETDVAPVSAAQRNSTRRKSWPLRMLEEHVFPDLPAPTLGVLGLAYKGDTHSTKNSPAIALLKSVPFCHVKAFDPVVEGNPAWHSDIEFTATADEAFTDVDAVLIMTDWSAFASLTVDELSAGMRGNVVVDPYRVLTPSDDHNTGLVYLCMGAPIRISDGVSGESATALRQ